MIDTVKQTVCFIGLGKMGAAMAANIQKAGYPLVVWNRSPEKAAALVAAGAILARTPKSAAAKADVVISSLADDKSLRAVVSGPRGILAGLRAGATHIGTSTIAGDLSEDLAKRHAAQGAHYVAGPVVGRVPAAEAAQLMTFVGGDLARIEALRPLISAYAPRIIVAGGSPSLANTAKLLVNFLGASAMDLIGQSLALGERSGLDRALVMGLLSGFFAAQATKDYVPKIAERDFDEVGFTTTGGLKDVELMIAAAKAVNLKLTSAEALRAKLRVAIKRGSAARDWSCFTEIDRG